jgi:hypothetical protein
MTAMRTTRWLAVALSTLMIGCAAKPQELIVGKWETTDLFGKPQTAEFTKEGTALLPIPVLNVRVDAKYKFVDDQHIDIEYPGNKTQRSEVVVTKETLTLTEEQSKIQRIFKRAK